MKNKARSSIALANHLEILGVALFCTAPVVLWGIWIFFNPASQAKMYAVRALQALLRFTPQLAFNVVCAFLGLSLVTTIGCTLAKIVSLNFDSNNRFRNPDFTAADCKNYLLNDEKNQKSLSGTLLNGYVWGCFYCLIAMYLLGSAKIFSTQAVVLAALAPFVALAFFLIQSRPAHETRKTIDSFRHLNFLKLIDSSSFKGTSIFKREPALLLAATFFLSLFPLCVSLTNPVPAWMDVFETNIAPVQRLITFESYDPRTALPAAYYTENRAVPLYSAFFAFVAKIFAISGNDIIAASLFPNLLVTLVAVYNFAKELGGRFAGVLAVWIWPLSFNYLHLQDSRSTCWQMSFGLFALATAWKQLSNRVEGHQDNRGNLILRSSIATGASVLAHPFLGFLTALSVIFIGALAIIYGGKKQIARFFMECLGITSISSLIFISWFPNEFLLRLLSGLCILVFVLILILFYDRISQNDRSDGSDFFQKDQIHRDTFSCKNFLLLVSYFACASGLIGLFFIRWNYAYMSEYPMLFLVNRYPVPVLLCLALLFFNLWQITVHTVKRRNCTAAAVNFCFVLWLFMICTAAPFLFTYFKLDDLRSKSLSYEFPLKTIDFWASGLFCALAVLPLRSLIFKKTITSVIFSLVFAGLVSLPLRLTESADRRQLKRSTGFIEMWERHLRLISDGYFRNEKNNRHIASKNEKALYDHLLSLCRRGILTSTDVVAHIAIDQYPSPAIQLSAFTGVLQDLFVADVSKSNIHTFQGRISAFSENFPQIRQYPWVLIEKIVYKSKLFSFGLSKIHDDFFVNFENDDFVLLQKKVL